MMANSNFENILPAREEIQLTQFNKEEERKNTRQGPIIPTDI